MSRCTGHCCKTFILGGGLSLTQLQELAAEGHHDAAVWLPLIESLGEHSEPPMSSEKLVGWSTTEPTTEPTTVKNEFFRCKALQPNGDCGVYGTDARPECCSRWPYNAEPCVFTECTWDQGRVPLISVDRLLRRLPLAVLPELDADN